MRPHPSPLQVDPEILRWCGSVISRTAVDAHETIRRHHVRMEDAMSGWGPASRYAMSEKLISWQSRTDRLATDITAYGESLTAAAVRYATQDAVNSRSLGTTADAD